MSSKDKIDLDSLVKKKIKSKKKKKKKKYLPIKCEYIKKNGKQCKRDAIGKGTLCRKHGGLIAKSALFNDQVMNLQDSCKYNPDYHPYAYLMLAQEGKSNAEIAAEFLISEVTLVNWSEKYNTFSMAFEIGKAMHESYYLGIAKKNLSNPMFQTSLFKFITANKLGFAEKVEAKTMNVHAHGVLRVPGMATDFDGYMKKLAEHNASDEDEPIDV